MPVSPGGDFWLSRRLRECRCRESRSSKKRCRERRSKAERLGQMTGESLIEKPENNRDVRREPPDLERNCQIRHVVIDRRNHGKRIMDADGFQIACIARIAMHDGLDRKIGNRLTIGRDDPEWDIAPPQKPGDANPNLAEAAEDYMPVEHVTSGSHPEHLS